MKWTNKSHEFDNIGKRFDGIDCIYLYGAGQVGTIVLNNISFLKCTIRFIDKNTKKQNTRYHGIPVISPYEFMERSKLEKCIVVLTLNDNYRLKTSLLCYGFIDGINLFEYHYFQNFFLPIYFLYQENKLIINRLGLGVTSKCTLKCKHCIAGIPGGNNKHRKYSKIKSQIDLIFQAFDRIENFVISGGEAIGHPNFREIINYIFKNFDNQFGILSVITNGLFNSKHYPSLLLFENKKMRLEWSDYTDTLDSKKVKLIRFNIDKIKSLDINLTIHKFDHWINYYVDSCLEYSDKEMSERFDNCLGRVNCYGVYDNCMPICGMTYLLSCQNPGKDDCIFIEPNKIDRFKYILLEAIYGFTDKGYLEMCRYCNGWFGYNDNIVIPGEQVV